MCRRYKVINDKKYYSTWSSVKEIKALKSSGNTSNPNKTDSVYTTETGKHIIVRKVVAD